ncbi:MAG TPA: DUF1361 domain-containing protein [Candidatus Sulfotelmatobacter sp.]|nr:DUF1361 domain-containing protein [Candidatus Sulfotelmatobacter sp.]HWI58151.1 DUF1361 domain-containing protein [Bacillota bacterium]
MRLIKLAFKRETAMPMLALLFASGVSVALVLARVLWTGDFRHSSLIWNLFLAWLPLVFALLAYDQFGSASNRNWRFLGWAAAWLLFFPNAPYIFTDLIHLLTRSYGHFWFDLVMILSCALTGLVLGFVSLYLMQSVVARRLGRLAGWIFIALVAALSSFGVYLGRFRRFNSWDIVCNPLELCRGIWEWLANPLAHPTTYAFPAVFAMFLFIAYLMLYALTHLQQHSPFSVPMERPQNPETAGLP